MEMTDGPTDATTTLRRISRRYLAYVAALSELPRAHVTAKRGGVLRRRAPRSRQEALFASISRATTSGASSASRNISDAGLLLPWRSAGSALIGCSVRSKVRGRRGRHAPEGKGIGAGKACAA